MRTVVEAARVRFGGKEGPAGWQFELTGGHPALDLANTLDGRPTPAPRELLPDYAALVRWSAQGRLIPDLLARRLEHEWAQRGAAAEACLRKARALRETLFELFCAVAKGRKLPAQELAALNAALPEALSRLRLHSVAPARVEWTFEHPQAALDAMLPPVVKAAADLLASPLRDRVRCCEGSGCAWLFLDLSRNRSRRWCDMTVCGNRAKARRHRARLRTPQG